MASGEGVEDAAEEEQIRHNAEALECAVREELRLQQQIQDTENTQEVEEVSSLLLKDRENNIGIFLAPLQNFHCLVLLWPKVIQNLARIPSATAVLPCCRYC